MLACMMIEIEIIERLRQMNKLLFWEYIVFAQSVHITKYSRGKSTSFSGLLLHYERLLLQADKTRRQRLGGNGRSVGVRFCYVRRMYAICQCSCCLGRRKGPLSRMCARMREASLCLRAALLLCMRHRRGSGGSG